MRKDVIDEVVSRVSDSKGMRHIRADFFNQIEELITSEEFTKVFDEELKIKNLTDDEVSIIVQLLGGD